MSNIEYIKKKLLELLSIVNELEEHFSDRKFTLDGHLFGSLGEVIASEFYSITLAPNSTKKHDGTIADKNVQIKITQKESIEIRDVPDYLLVLFWNKQDGEIYEVYNGPCDWLRKRKLTKNGEYSVTLITLFKENYRIPDDKRIKSNTDIKKWQPASKAKN